jgi:hypothetical protein
VFFIWSELAQIWMCTIQPIWSDHVQHNLQFVNLQQHPITLQGQFLFEASRPHTKVSLFNISLAAHAANLSVPFGSRYHFQDSYLQIPLTRFLFSGNNLPKMFPSSLIWPFKKCSQDGALHQHSKTNKAQDLNYLNFSRLVFFFIFLLSKPERAST